MENLKKLQEKINILDIEVKDFVVIVKEDNYNNTGDPNYYEAESFKTLEEAYNDFISEKENISSLETESEYKIIEFAVSDEKGDLKEVEVEAYKMQYTAEDYGKYLLSYRPTNNGVEGIKIVLIDEKTPYCVSPNNKFSVKFEVVETREDVVLRIYDLCLYISMEDAEEQFDLSLC